MADGTLGATGRKVRCARCGTVWHATPNDYPEAPVDVRPSPTVATGPEPSEDEWRDAITGDGPKSKFDEVEDGNKENDQSSIDDLFASGGSEENDQSSIDDLFASGGDKENDQSSIDDMFASGSAEEDAGNDQSSIDDLFATDSKADAGEDEPEGAAAALAEAPPVEDVQPTIDAPPAGFEEPQRKRKKKPSRRKVSAFGALDRHLSTPVATSLLIGFLVGSIVLAILAREKIVAALPDLAGIYELIGMPVNLRGMEIDALSAHREMDGSTPVLVVEGDIINLEGFSKPLPAVRVTLKSSTGRDVYAWNYTLPQLNIDQEGKIHFKTRLLAPPEASVNVEVRFTDQRQP
jgi:hypothetical protein